MGNTNYHGKYEICRMKVLVVAATENEIKPYLLEQNSPDILITGVGIPATIYCLTMKLLSKNYDLALQAGIAGVLDDRQEIGATVVVNKDTFGDLGIRESGAFQPLADTGFLHKDEPPYSDGWLVNPHTHLQNISLPPVSAVTINTVTDDIETIRMQQQQFNADIESMEGAAFHYVCLQQKIPFLQIRSISNRVGERNKDKWEIKKAIANLNDHLIQIIENLKR
jgi:futalosine hydrolase